MHCVFCDIIAGKIVAQLVYEDDLVVGFWDKYPQSRGHLQLVPKKHVRWVYEIGQIEAFFATAKRITRDIIPVLGATHATWATFGHEIEHAHLWIVPRYTKVSRLHEGSKEQKVVNTKELQDLISNALRGGV